MSRAEGLRHVGAFRRRDVADLRRFRIEHWQTIGRILRRAVKRTMTVHRGIALVGRNQVVEILLLVAPVPRRYDDVALDALRPRRFGEWQLALSNAIGPVAEILERHAPELAGERIDHLRRGLTGLHAPHPGFFTALEF